MSYRGRAYAGWQTQSNAHTIQAQIEHDLSLILRVPTSIIGAGRTDAGVNARGMVAQFDTSDPIVDPSQVVRQLNSLLPRDISIHRIRPVVSDAHARFSATARTYRYYVSLSKDPFSGEYFHHMRKRPDFERMNEAAALLLEYDDFKSFSKVHTDVKTFICHIREAYWSPIPALVGAPLTLDSEVDQYAFTITADRFLRNMVRAIVGTLFMVGVGKLNVQGFRQVILSRDRSAAGSSALSGALFLESVTYPESIFLD